MWISNKTLLQVVDWLARICGAIEVQHYILCFILLSHKNQRPAQGWPLMAEEEAERHPSPALSMGIKRVHRE